jgi:hypothetical protein
MPVQVFVHDLTRLVQTVVGRQFRQSFLKNFVVIRTEQLNEYSITLGGNNPSRWYKPRFSFKIRDDSTQLDGMRGSLSNTAGFLKIFPWTYNVSAVFRLSSWVNPHSVAITIPARNA